MRHMRLLLVPLLLIACAEAEDQALATAGPDVDAVRSWADRTIAAYNAADVDATFALYAPDALSIPPTETVTDATALRQSFAAFLAANTLEFTATIEDAVVSGDLGILRVAYRETFTARVGGAQGEQYGTWLVVLRRQPDGSWKLWRDAWSTLTPPADAT